MLSVRELRSRDSGGLRQKGARKTRRVPGMRERRCNYILYIGKTINSHSIGESLELMCICTSVEYLGLHRVSRSGPGRLAALTEPVTAALGSARLKRNATGHSSLQTHGSCCALRSYIPFTPPYPAFARTATASPPCWSNSKSPLSPSPALLPASVTERDESCLAGPAQPPQ